MATFIDGGTAIPLAQVSTHRMGLVYITPNTTALQLQAVLPEVEWQFAGAMTASQYADLSLVTLKNANLKSDLNARPWLQHGIAPGALATTNSALQEGMEKTATPLGKCMNDSEVAARRLAPEKAALLEIGIADTFALPDASADDPPWQLKVSYGVKLDSWGKLDAKANCKAEGGTEGQADDPQAELKAAEKRADDTGGTEDEARCPSKLTHVDSLGQDGPGAQIGHDANLYDKPRESEAAVAVSAADAGTWGVAEGGKGGQCAGPVSGADGEQERVGVARRVGETVGGRICSGKRLQINVANALQVLKVCYDDLVIIVEGVPGVGLAMGVSSRELAGKAVQATKAHFPQETAYEIVSEIKESFPADEFEQRRRRYQAHPDKASGDSIKFDRLKQAWDMLVDKERRQFCDAFGWAGAFRCKGVEVAIIEPPQPKSEQPLSPEQELLVLVTHPDGTVRAVQPRQLTRAPDELGISNQRIKLVSCQATPAEWPTFGKDAAPLPVTATKPAATKPAATEPAATESAATVSVVTQLSDVTAVIATAAVAARRDWVEKLEPKSTSTVSAATDSVSDIQCAEIADTHQAISISVTDVGTDSVTDFHARMTKTLSFDVPRTERVGAPHSRAAAAFYMLEENNWLVISCGKLLTGAAVRPPTSASNRTEGISTIPDAEVVIPSSGASNGGLLPLQTDPSIIDLVASTSMAEKYTCNRLRGGGVCFSKEEEAGYEELVAHHDQTIAELTAEIERLKAEMAHMGSSQSAALPPAKAGEEFVLLPTEVAAKGTTAEPPPAAATVPAAAEEDSLGEWTIAAWMKSLGLVGVVADAVGSPHASKEQLAYAKSLDFEKAKQLLHTANIEDTLAQAIAQASAVLREGVMTATALNAKFANEEASFELAVGSLDVFYGGLERLVGPPHMIDGSLARGMEAEHCDAVESDVPFTSSNGLTSTSRVEWEFVIHPDVDKVYSERNGFREAHQDKVRKPEPLSTFLARMEERNALLEKAGHTPLIWEEVVGGRLYTGPLYEKYNLVLRSKSGNPFLVSRFEKVCQGNHYCTTLHAINSCIIKMSKLMKAQPIYRGSTRAKLPHTFLHADAFGIKGGIEYAFTSTTVEREQAMHYAQGAASTVFEMEMGMIDRGADVSWLSQYEYEREVLFPPLMGLEVRDIRVDRGTLVVEARLSLNLTSQTLEQVVSKRKKLIIDMDAQMATEVRKGCTPSTADAAERMLHTKLTGLLAEAPTFFNNDAHFQNAVGEALKVKRSVVLAATMATTAESLAESMPLVELLQGNVVDLRALELAKRGAHVALVTTWMGSNPAGLTKLTLDGSKVCAEVVDALPALAAGTSTLVDLDIKEGRSLNILQLNGSEHVESLDLSKSNHGPLSGAIICACIRGNRVLTSLDLRRNAIGDSGAKALAEALKLNAVLTQLNLAGNDLGVDGAKAIAGALSSGMAVLKSINLSNNNLTNYGEDMSGIQAIADSLKSGMAVLKSIVLSHNQIEDEGAIAIGESLKTNNSLETLELVGCDIGPAGGQAIGVGLQAGIAVLTDLNLRSNKLGPQGAAAIAEALKSGMAVLTDLNLAINGIGPVGAAAIAEALKSGMAVLTDLNLRENVLDEESRRALTDAAKRHTDPFDLKL